MGMTAFEIFNVAIKWLFAPITPFERQVQTITGRKTK